MARTSFKGSAAEAIEDYADEVVRPKAKAHSVIAYVTTRATGGGDGPYKGDKKPRTAHDNYTILATQRSKYGRDPAFIDDNEIARGNGLWQLGFEKMVQEGADLVKIAEETATAVGNYMVLMIKKHVKEGRSAQGPMPPLQRGEVKDIEFYSEKHGKKLLWKKQKMRKKYGDQKDDFFPGKPILVRTGQLIYKSLIAHWRMI